MNALIISRALDTNGQNTRFVRAAERFGTDPDVLKALVIGNTDPGGVMGRFQAAALHEGGLSIRSAHRAEQYFEFPGDIRWTRANHDVVRQLAREADIIHLNNSWAPYRTLGLHKPALLHHHGSMFRKDPERMLARAKSYRMTQAVSTIDLQRPAPRLLHWLPTAYDLDALADMRVKRPDDGMVRVVSAPTNRAYKATEALIAAAARLKAEGVPIELVLVEGVTWAECLEAKATADVLFDQVAFGYGCNAVEAWGMGIPVIAGADPWTLERMRHEWGSLPFYEASEATIADALRAMVESADLRAEWAAKGAAHAAKYHAEKPALARLAELYALTIKDWQTVPVLSERVVFRNEQQRPLYDREGVRLVFTDGLLETTDPFVVESLRRFSNRRRFGVHEVVA